MTFRLRIIFLAGSVFFMGFSYFDNLIYPIQSYTFVMLRVIICTLLIVLWLFTHLPRFKFFVFAWMFIGYFLVASGLCSIVYLSDGAASRYYEGFHVLMLALPVVNSFYIWPNAVACAVVLAEYLTAVILNPVRIPPEQFFIAPFNLTITSAWVVLITRLFSRHHYREFAATEEIRRSEKKIEESYENLGKLYDEVETMSKLDDLTRVANRRFLFGVLSRRMEIAKNCGHTFYLAIFDIDWFKRINDEFGHSIGDEVITNITRCVKSNIRKNNFIARYGGDEFIILFSDGPIERIQARLNALAEKVKTIPFFYNGKPISLSISVGAARFNPSVHAAPESLIRSADQSLLKVKQAERGKVLIEY